MDKITITLKLPSGLKAWLAAEGDPLYRKDTEQAAFLCAQYLTQAYKRAQQTAKPGTLVEVPHASD